MNHPQHLKSLNIGKKSLPSIGLITSHQLTNTQRHAACRLGLTSHLVPECGHARMASWGWDAALQQQIASYPCNAWRSVIMCSIVNQLSARNSSACIHGYSRPRQEVKNVVPRRAKRNQIQIHDAKSQECDFDLCELAYPISTATDLKLWSLGGPAQSTLEKKGCVPDPKPGLEIKEFCQDVVNCGRDAAVNGINKQTKTGMKSMHRHRLLSSMLTHWKSSLASLVASAYWNRSAGIPWLSWLAVLRCAGSLAVALSCSVAGTVIDDCWRAAISQVVVVHHTCVFRSSFNQTSGTPLTPACNTASSCIRLRTNELQ